MHRQLDVLLNRELAWVVIPETALASRPARTIKLPRGARIAPHWASGRGKRGAGFTAGRASELRNVKCQSLYFGPPW
jgi:hypothetical protein